MTHLPILQAKEIHKSFYHPAMTTILRGVNLTVMRGDTVAIMGRSGEGKSTLLQILGTLEAPSSGNIEIDGHTATSFNKSRLRNKNLAFVFQSFHLLEDYTALENALMPAKIGREDTSKGSPAYSRVSKLLGMVGLDSRKHYNTKLLSGGEKQRVAIVRALCNDPDIILADEPSGNLDKETSHQIHELLINFAREYHKALIVVTHDADLANLCASRYTLSEGLLKTSSH